MARPFLKWAGGKRQLLPKIEERLPHDIENCNTYIEPFVGGGSVLFSMLERFNFEDVHILDINAELILCYQAIRDVPTNVSKSLKQLREGYPSDKEGQKEVYYRIREKWNLGVGKEIETASDIGDRAATTIFLNKTCFNGLFRVNKSGLFNVPCNYTENPSFPTEKEILEVHESLKDVNLKVAEFEYCENLADETSFIYFDPPYRPLTDSSGFVSYSKEDFNDDDQRKLADLYRRLNSKGSKMMLSNSDPRNSNPDDDFFDELYSGFTIDRVMARRSIDSVGEGRGEITEIIVTNYSPH